MDLVKKTDYNAKITEIESKISSISSLAANFALTAVENKIPDVSSLVKKKKKKMIMIMINILQLQNLII